MNVLNRLFRVTALALAALAVHCAAPQDEEEADDTEEGLQGAAVPRGCTHVQQGEICWAFNRLVPSNNDDDRTITDELVRLVDGQSGGSLKLNVYEIGPDVERALATAKNAHGVAIQATIDGARTHLNAADALHTLLGSALHACDGRGGNSSCLHSGTTGIAHVKFMDFSDTATPDGKAHHPATMFTTANFGGGSLHGNWNNLVTFYDATGNKDLYDGVDAWANDMYAERRRDVYGRHIVSRGFGVEVWASPTGPDIWAKVLGRYEGYRGTPSGAPHACKVWVMADLARITGPLDELDRLRRDGCKVKMVLHEPPDEPGARARLRAMDEHGVRFRKATTHEKTVVIQARTRDGRYGKWVLTGSNNFYWSGHAANDEALVEIHNAVLRDRFAEHFWEEWKNSEDWAPPKNW